MRTKAQFVLVLMIASALLSPLAFSATKRTTRYEVERAWFDSAHLYILYKEDTTKVSYSLADVHGTVLSDKKKVRIASYSRSELKDGSVVMLDNGKSAEAVVYEDSDFAITTIMGEEVSLSGEKIKGSIPICGKRKATGWPIAQRGGIFYCATLYSSSGHVTWTVPDTVLDSMKAELQLTANPLMRALAGEPRPVYYFEGEEKLATVAVSVDSANLKIATWSAGTNDISWTSVAVGPPGSTASVANGVVAYSPNNVVLKVHRDRELYWARCRNGECNRISGVSASSSYLLLDDVAAQAIAILIPDLTKPQMHLQITALR